MVKIKKNNLKKENLVHIFLSIVLFVIHIHYISKLYMPYLNDDFGYWSSAYFLTGTNWKNMMYGVPYYSYGYGFLLSPLVIIFKNPIILYRAAIAVNALCVVIIYYVLVKIVEKICKDVNSLKREIICFSVLSYSAFVCLSRIAFSEILLVTVITVLIYIWLSVEEKPTVSKLILIAVLTGYIYMIHLRMLSVVVGSSLCIIMLYMKKKIKTKCLLSYSAVLAILLVMGNKYKNKLQSELWQMSGTNTDVNDYSVQLNKFVCLLKEVNILLYIICGSIIIVCIFFAYLYKKKHIKLNAKLYCPKILVSITIIMWCIILLGVMLVAKAGEGNVVITLVKEVCGQFFYMGASTFGLAWFGLFYLIENMIFDKEDYRFTKGFILISVIVLFAISNIYYSNTPDRIDQLIYGRYNEPFFAILIIFGLLWLTKAKINKLYYVIGAMPVMVSLGYLVQKRIDMLEYDNYPSISAAGLWAYYNSYEWSMLKIGSFCAVIMLIIAFTLIVKKQIINIIGLFLFVVINIYMGNITIVENTLDSQQEYKRNENIIETINEVDLPIYCLQSSDSTVYRWKNMYQFLFPRRDVRYASLEEILKDKSEKLVIVNDKNDFWYSLGMGENYTLIDIASRYALYISDGIKLDELQKNDMLSLEKNNIINIPLSFFKTKESSWGENKAYIESNGKEGKILYGLQQFADKATYEIEICLEGIEYNIDDDIAVVQIIIGENVVNEKIITGNMLNEENKINVNIDYTVEEYGNKIGVVVRSKENKTIRIKSVFAKKINKS